MLYSYVITEWCICSVEDLYGTRSNEGTKWIGKQIFVEKIKKSLDKTDLMASHKRTGISASFEICPPKPEAE